MIAAYATYFDGFLSEDKRAQQIYETTGGLLKFYHHDIKRSKKRLRQQTRQPMQPSVGRQGSPKHDPADFVEVAGAFSRSVVPGYGVDLSWNDDQACPGLSKRVHAGNGRRIDLGLPRWLQAVRELGFQCVRQRIGTRPISTASLSREKLRESFSR